MPCAREPEQVACVFGSGPFSFTCEITPSCSVQFAPQSKTLPEHTCYEMAMATVENFASKRFIVTGRAMSWYMNSWPLPIGWTSIGQWAADHKDHYGEALDSCPQPLVQTPDAWLGLAVERTIVHQPTENPLDLSDDEIRQWFARHRDDWRTLLRERQSTVWLLGLVEPKGTDEERTWRFVAPLLLLESRAVSPKETQAVATAEDALRRWYLTHLLGQHVGPGRPKGPGQPIMPDFLQRYPKAYQQVEERRDSRPTKLDVAAELGLSLRAFYTYLRDFHCSFPPDESSH